MMRVSKEIIAVTVGLLSTSLWGLAQQPADKARATASPDARQVEAKSTFASVCASCHGLDGRGGERGPDISSRAEVVGKGDGDLLRILREGKISKGMPSFAAIGEKRLLELVAYLRALQGSGEATKLRGDPARGKDLFFGAAKCSGCHMMAGQGGFLAPDLTTYAARKSPDEIGAAIVVPNQNRDLRRKSITVQLNDGTVLTGVPRNEDNFSLQLQTEDGKFHLLDKESIAKFSRAKVSAMSSDYGKALSENQINDLISYLVATAAATNAQKPGSSPEYGDDE